MGGAEASVVTFLGVGSADGLGFVLLWLPAVLLVRHDREERIKARIKVHSEWAS